MLRKREKEVLFELLKNGRAHDKGIAKRIGTTQPTVTRIRQKLEKKGYIKRYAAVACLQKAGLDLIVFTLFRWTDYSKEDERRKAAKETRQREETIYLGTGEGLNGKTGVIISAHKSFNEYSEYIKELRKRWGSCVDHIDQFFCPINDEYTGFITGPPVIAVLSKEKYDTT